MMNEADLAASVRRADPDRFLAALFAPAAKRPHLLLLYAFNNELARARAATSSGLLALIRLQWWREVVEGAVRAHPVATQLGAAIATGVFQRGDLLAMIEAREAESEPIPDRAAFLIYMRGTAGVLMRTAGAVLGITDAAGRAALEDCGTGTGIVLLLRALPALYAVGRNLLPADGTPPASLLAEARPLLTIPTPPKALAAALPAILARRDLIRMDRGRPPAPRGLADRIAVLAAGVRGRM